MPQCWPDLTSVPPFCWPHVGTPQNCAQGSRAHGVLPRAPLSHRVCGTADGTLVSTYAVLTVDQADSSLFKLRSRRISLGATLSLQPGELLGCEGTKATGLGSNPGCL